MGTAPQADRYTSDCARKSNLPRALFLSLGAHFLGALMMYLALNFRMPELGRVGSVQWVSVTGLGRGQEHARRTFSWRSRTHSGLSSRSEKSEDPIPVPSIIASENTRPSEAGVPGTEAGAGDPNAISGTGSGGGGGTEGEGLVMLSDGKPEYPEVSRRRGEQGQTTMILQVSEDGSVREASIGQSAGYARLDEAALVYAKKLKFRVPSRSAFPIRKRISILFGLK